MLLKPLQALLLASSLALMLSACMDESKDDPAPAPGTPAVESSRAATAKVGRFGDTLQCESSKGITYTLEIPPGSLPESTEIKLSPLKDLGSRPLASGFLGGVRCEPSGLKLLRPITLRIKASSSLPEGRRLVGFSADDTGGSLRLSPVRAEGGEIVVAFNHFSLHGAAGATPETIDELPELAPLATPFEAAQEAIALISISDAGASAEQLAAILSRYFIESVKPIMEKSLGADDATVVDGIPEFAAWQALIEFAAAVNNMEAAAIVAELSKEIGEGKTLAASTLKRLIRESNGNCAESADITEFQEADIWQGTAKELGLDSLKFGLDRNAFLRDACVRVVLDPLKLPSPLPKGTPKSFDARAQLVFIGSPDPKPGPFDFTLTARGATLANPRGFSDAEGRYTTVMTAEREEDVAVDVKACAVLPGISDLCVTGTSSAQSIHRVRVEIDRRYDGNGPRTGPHASCSDTLKEIRSRIPAILEDACEEYRMKASWVAIENGVRLDLSANSPKTLIPGFQHDYYILKMTADLAFLPDRSLPMEFEVEHDSRGFSTPMDPVFVAAGRAEPDARLTSTINLSSSTNPFDKQLILENREDSIMSSNAVGHPAKNFVKMDPEPLRVPFKADASTDTLRLRLEIECAAGCSGTGAIFKLTQKSAAP